MLVGIADFVVSSHSVSESIKDARSENISKTLYKKIRKEVSCSQQIFMTSQWTEFSKFERQLCMGMKFEVATEGKPSLSRLNTALGHRVELSLSRFVI